MRTHLFKHLLVLVTLLTTHSSWGQNRLHTFPLAGDSVKVYTNGRAVQGLVYFAPGSITTYGGHTYLTTGSSADSISILVGDMGQIAGHIIYNGGTVFLSALDMLEYPSLIAYKELSSMSMSDRTTFFLLIGNSETKVETIERVRLSWKELSVEVDPITYRNILGRNQRRRNNIEFMIALFSAVEQSQ